MRTYPSELWAGGAAVSIAPGVPALCLLARVCEWTLGPIMRTSAWAALHLQVGFMLTKPFNNTGRNKHVVGVPLAMLGLSPSFSSRELTDCSWTMAGACYKLQVLKAVNATRLLPTCVALP